MSSRTRIMLKNQQPFAQGGNRLCFVHPDQPERVIKVRRPDVSLEHKRKKKGFPKNLRPLSSFDDNVEELQVMESLDQLVGAQLYQCVARCYGFKDTDMGPGLVSDLIRDDGHNISHTLKQYIWDNGFDEPCQNAVDQFAESWVQLAIPSRDLLLHNIVVQRNHDGAIQRLVVIDGLGSPNILPVSLLPMSLRRNKARRKIENMRSRISRLESERGRETFPGYHGLLLHDGTDNNASKDSPDKRTEHND